MVKLQYKLIIMLSIIYLSSAQSESTDSLDDDSSDKYEFKKRSLIFRSFNTIKALPLTTAEFKQYISEQAAVLIQNNIILDFSESAQIQEYPDITLNFNQYLNQFNIAENYKTYSERRYRELIYYQNIKTINQFNKQQDIKYNFYLNQFVDIQPKEFRSIYATLTPQIAQYDQVRTRLLQKQQNQSNQTQSNIDWSCYTGSIDNQGICGSCYAFIAADTVSSLYAIHKNKFHIKLSVQQLISCQQSVSSNGCKGGLFKNTFDYIQKEGITTALNYPYSSAFSTEPHQCDKTKKQDSNKNHITSYKKLQRNCQTLKKQLTKGPLAVGINSQKLQFYSNGIFEGSPHTTTDHAVLLIGYDPNIGFKIKNIWGRTWGIQGYAWIDFEKHAGICSRAYSIEIPDKLQTIKSCSQTQQQQQQVQPYKQTSQSSKLPTKPQKQNKIYKKSIKKQTKSNQKYNKNIFSKRFSWLNRWFNF